MKKITLYVTGVKIVYVYVALDYKQQEKRQCLVSLYYTK